MNGLKKIISIILLSILFNQNEKDTTNKIPIIDFSKGFNIPGIIPEEIPMFSGGLPLFPKDIEAIIAKSGNSGPVQTIRVEQAPLKITTDTKPQEPYKM